MPAAASNPFFLLFEGRLLAPLVLLTTAATVIASQAVISGAFALVQQAIQFGTLPRLDVRQTSHESAGQVYVPQVNWLLAIVVLGLVFGFGSSDALANAYGIAVAGDMLVTTVLVATVAHGVWKWSWWAIAPALGLFLVLDTTFVAANVHKIPAGGWFPLVTGALLLTMMLCWRRGRAVAMEKRDERAVEDEAFFARLARPDAPLRVPGTAVYLTQSLRYIPEALVMNLRHNGVVHERVILLTVSTERVPRIAERSRVTIEKLPAGFDRIEMKFGFAEKPDVPAALDLHRALLAIDPDGASYFLGRETPVPSLDGEMPRWQERIYAFLAHNSVRAPDYFLIPPAQVVELGTRVEM